MPTDYYSILGVSKTASQDEIKTAFRKLAHKYHPDKVGGNEAKFKEINEAYQVLGDPDKRAKYDQFGSAAFEGAQGFGAGGFQGFDFGSAGFGDIGDIFGDMFGGGRSSRRQERGADIQADLELNFKEAVFGTEKELNITKLSSCERCAGTGAEPGSGTKECSQCSGRGVKTFTQRTILGNIQSKRMCDACVGRGEVPKKNCASCAGEGVEKRKERLSVNVPSGVDDGSVLRLGGKGEALRGGRAGDLYLRLHVKTDARFERDGSQILSHAKIGFTQAALGDTIDVETVDGIVSLKIPAGTQSGTLFRLRAKGVPTSRGRGDHLVTVAVRTPEKLSREQKRLLEELGDEI
jgi:molecular chaperone DnaJ